MQNNSNDNQGQGSRDGQFNENENRGNLGHREGSQNMESRNEAFDKRSFDADEEIFASDTGMASGQSTTRDDSWEAWNGPDAGRSESQKLADRLEEDETYSTSGSGRYEGMGEGYSADSRDTSRLDNEARMASDNDDFTNSGWDESFAPDTDTREAQSRTFNEDKETWEEEQRMGGASTGNSWTENDDYGRYTADDEQRDASSHGRYNDNEQNNYGQENDRRNREELE